VQNILGILISVAYPEIWPGGRGQCSNTFATKEVNLQGCHLAFKKAESALFGLLLKQFSRNKMIWLFFNLEENSIFLELFWLNFNKTFNILRYFEISLIYFGKFSLKIWP
jgi:hypothetical protein